MSSQTFKQSNEYANLSIDHFQFELSYANFLRESKELSTYEWAKMVLYFEGRERVRGGD